MSAVEVLVPLVLGVIVTEAVDVCPWLARKLVRWSARRIHDESMAERYEEEWLAGLEGRPGKLLQLVSAISILVGASWQMRDIFRTADSSAGAGRRNRWPRPHKQLALPSSLREFPQYLGYGVPVLLVAAWVNGQSVQLILFLAVMSMLYLAFQVPTYCGGQTRHGDPCRNRSHGLLLGCHIRQHKWRYARRVR